MNTEKMSHVVSMTANVGVLIGLSLLVYELNLNNRHLEEQRNLWRCKIEVEPSVPRREMRRLDDWYTAISLNSRKPPLLESAPIGATLKRGG